ncbi:Imm49 family immunity protein [Streptomyces sp. NPDC015144]|uniref:immunity 49 family protein n=1 Tax=Streptomyces sp. NPDC015144 TaxID=3364944 RepID=UPI0036FD60D7
MERHQVDGAAVRAALGDFPGRIGGRVRSLSRAEGMTGAEWRLVADEFLDHLGALSLGTPDLATPEARALLVDAATAATGAVSYAAFHPHGFFEVFLKYVNFGVDHEPGAGGPVRSVSPGEWTDALCLAVLADLCDGHVDAFMLARNAFAGRTAGTPAGELTAGLAAVVLDDPGPEGTYPPGPEAKLASVDAALDRLRARAEETGEPLPDRPDGVALCALRALAAGDRGAFDTALAGLLAGESAPHGPSAAPRTLLPRVPLALAALGYRTRGWAPAVSTDYLPHALVTGFETPGPRVAGFGRDRRPDAVAALVAGPLVVERPVRERTVTPQARARAGKRRDEAFAAGDGEPLSAWWLGAVLADQERLFKMCTEESGRVTRAQLAHLGLASGAAAALFRLALAEPGTTAEVTVDGRTLRYRAERGDRTAGPHWRKAVALALVAGSSEDLAPTLLAGPALARADDSAFAAYHEALHALLTGADPEPAARRALDRADRLRDSGFPMPPAVLLSQLVAGDEESFGLALADALEAHRDQYLIADRADDPDGALDLDILALACLAVRRGWSVRVESAYLPRDLLRAAEPS